MVRKRFVDMRKTNVIRRSTGDLILDIFIYGFLSIVLVVELFPLIFVASASISSPNAVWMGKVWLLPKEITLKGYEMAFGYKTLWIGYRNTIIYTVLGTCINLFMTITAAYPLSRKDFYAKNFITAVYTFTMFFSGGLIPTYILVKQLGMINKIWALLIPGAVSTYNIIITRTFFQTNIPDELKDASIIDGCSNIKMLMKVVLPLSMPIIAVMALFYGVGHWNAFFSAYIYLSDRMKYPLQVFLREILIKSQIESEAIGGVSPLEAYEHHQRAETLKYAVIIVSSVPVLMVYPFIQRYFVKGMLIGSIKG